MKIELRLILVTCLLCVFGCVYPFNSSTEVGGDYHISPLEKDIVREIALARTNPRRYASFIEERKKHYDGKLFYTSDGTILRTKEGVRAANEATRFLRSVSKLSPLSLSRGMSLGAKDHVRDIGPRGATRHEGRDGSKTSDRVNRYGTWQGQIGENIFYGGEEAREIVMGLIIDDGVSSRGHRRNIFNPSFRVVGVGCGYHDEYRTVCVITFAMGYIEK